MLAGTILNSDAQLNYFVEIKTKQFIPGEQFKLVIRLVNDELGSLRYIPPSTATFSVNLNKTDGTILTKTNADITPFTDDRSILSILIQESESEELASGSFTFSIDMLGDGTEIKKGIATNALSRTIDGSC